MTHPPSIAILKSRLGRQGGLEKYTWEIAKAFCQTGSQVTLLTTGSVEAPFSSSNLQVVSFPLKHCFSYAAVRKFDQACQHYLSSHPTSITFSLDRNSEQTHLRAGNGVHAAYLRHRREQEGFFKSLSFRFNPLHRNLLAIEKASFESLKLRTLFTNSHMVKNEVLEFYQVDPKKISVVHNGVEWTLMQSAFDAWQQQRQEVLEEFHLDPQAYQLLFIGHNYRRKGLETLLKGMSLLKGAPIQLCVIGKDRQQHRFEKLAHDLKLDSAVRFLGHRSNTFRFYQMADALAIPSFYDPFANVTVEALAMGLFVISSRTNGGSEVVKPFSGTTIEELTDPASVAHSLQTALNHPKTAASAGQVRASVEELDFPKKLQEIVNLCSRS